jgi:hypothetical protein
VIVCDERRCQVSCELQFRIRFMVRLPGHNAL